MSELIVKGNLKPGAPWQKKNMKIMKQWEKKAFPVTFWYLVANPKFYAPLFPFRVDLGMFGAAPVLAGSL